jgi:L-aminopeptidase/D-esterase-like protein
MYNSITDIRGISVGHYTDLKNATGCTVILPEKGAIGGVEVRGSAPGTRETDLLRPMNLVQEIHGILLSGGSAFGLNAAGGVQKYLEEREIGFKIGPTVVPIVPAAILFDLGLLNHKVRPTEIDAYQSCLNATKGSIKQGTVGAGTGATVGKILGFDQSTKGGIGTASIRMGSGISVGAIVAVNAFGDIIDPNDGQLIAGPRNIKTNKFENTNDYLLKQSNILSLNPTNTTIGVIATDAKLNKEQVNRLATFAHNGLAQAVRPSHTMSDGDAFFSLATGESSVTPNMNSLGVAVVKVVIESILNAIKCASGLGNIPSISEINATNTNRK